MNESNTTNTTNLSTNGVNTSNTPDNNTPDTIEEGKVTKVVPDSTEEEKSYSQQELDSIVAKAINDAVAKAKKKANQTSEERITELENQIRQRDLADYSRNAMQKASISPNLTPLFLGSDEEDIDTKIKCFNSWFSKAIEEAVRERVGESKPINLKPSNLANAPKHLTLAELQKVYNSKH